MREKRLLARLPLPARLKLSSIQTCGRNLKRALIGLIDNHDEALAAHFADGKLALESTWSCRGCMTNSTPRECQPSC